MPTLNEAKTKVQELSAKALAVVEHPTMSSAEKKSALDRIDPDIKYWISEVKELTGVADQVKNIFGGNPGIETGGPVHNAQGQVRETRSLAQQFTDSDNFKNINPRGGRFDTGAVELKVAGTVDEGGLGAGLVIPIYRAGIVDLRFMPLVVADLFAQGSITGNTLSYVKESAFTDGTATVAEKAKKPYSDDAFVRLTESLGKIASLMKLTNEVLEDVPTVQSFVSARMVGAVGRKEQSELLNGTGLPGVAGLLGRAGLAPTVVQAIAPDNAADALFRQITAIRTISFIEPDGIVMSPTDWQKLRLAKDGQGQYYAGGPFTGAYGTGTLGNPYSIWGLKVVVTPAQAVGTAVVGAFQEGGQVFRRNGITVEMTNSNVDDFENNLVTLRVEERLLLAVYRPSGFGKVTLI